MKLFWVIKIDDRKTTNYKVEYRSAVEKMGQIEEEVTYGLIYNAFL